MTVITSPYPRPPRRLWLAILAGPLAWSAQGMIGWYVSGLACIEHVLTGSARAIELTLTAAALAAAIAGFVVGRSAWQRASHEKAINAIQGHERPAFLGASAMLVSAVFVVAVLLVGIAQVTVPVCEWTR